ncbi:hypothetical protein B0H66DRAFT_553027 [Apodospora peruviana]|uniref:Uncharacterized protein n=1 Tax=Apodospora peruviana TaxID=516989 RepID=A0AAE0M8L2_9PEZI|nr:hypothetical protein B0H66DRAFT_553027 [Apodospora peruviana]
MARYRQTARDKGKRLITWTRFRLPPNHEWPAWPCLTAAGHDAVNPVGNPLEGVGGTSCYAITLGRMVDFPQEAVCMIEWEYMDDLTNFLASPACDEFLRLLDEHGDNDDTLDEVAYSSMLSWPPLLSGAAAAAQIQTMELIFRRRRRSRFLILKHFSEAATSTIQGRVTLSTFVITAEKEDGYASLCKAYPDVRETFGRFDRPNHPPDPELIERYGRASSKERVWFYARGIPAEEKQEDMSETWVEKTFGRAGSGGGQQPPLVQSQSSASDGGSPPGPQPKALMCEFRVWNDMRDEIVNLGNEEAHAKDAEIKEIWDQVMGEWMSDGRILAWKRERWDFEPVMRFWERIREKKKKK